MPAPDDGEIAGSAANRRPGKLMPVGLISPCMTVLSFDDKGVDVVYEGIEFRLERDLIEEATRKQYVDATDHEVLQMVEEDPELGGEPRRIGDIID